MSLNISLSGLNASSKELNTISNNIANVSTTGFKESRTEFSSVYSGGQSNGVEVVGISQNFDSNGQISGTGRALDMALSGAGFFVVEDGKGQTSYTRNGIFNMDSNGYVVSNSNAKLQGYSVDGDNKLQQGTVGPIKISTQAQAAKATTNAEFVANLDARSDVITATFDPKDSATYTNSYTTPAYDSLGNPHTVTQYFVKTGEKTWDVYAVVDGGTATTPETMTFDVSGKLTSGNTYTVSTPVSGAEDLNITMKLDGVTQFGNNFVVSTNNPDGYTSGDYVDMRVEADGSIYANYSNGQTQLQGQVVLANFSAPSELQQTNNTSWVQSFGSGVPIIGTAGTGSFGELTSGALESSNVDLTQSLVSMMTAQRNYQANTKAISTDSQLTQALFQAM